MVKVSIIVPVYKVEKYLEKCIQSILEQTFKDFELILVDDGSPDKCGTICDNYLKIDNRVEVIHKENGGLSSARNAGLEIAKGKYVGFVDSDDWIKKTMYEKLYTLAKYENADIAQCNYIKVFDEYEINRSDNYNVNANIKILNNLQSLDNLYNENVSQTIVTWSKIYKRNLFNDVKFPIGKLNEDKFTTYKLLYKSKIVVFTDEQLYYYRQTPNSIMNSAFSKRNLDAVSASEETLCFFKGIGNKQLYAKALKKYECELKTFYFKCEDLLEIDEGDILKRRLKEKHNSIFNEYLHNNQVEIKKKLSSSIFFMSPRIYKKMQALRGKQLY